MAPTSVLVPIDPIFVVFCGQKVHLSREVLERLRSCLIIIALKMYSNQTLCDFYYNENLTHANLKDKFN